MSSVAPPGRIAALDVLRGAAMLGILSVNIWFFAVAAINAGASPDWGGAADQLAFAISTLLFSTKSYVLFAFLFGYSFVLQEGPDFVRRMRRRMLALIVIGVLHAVLLWRGDILVLYGVLGFVLIAMRELPPRRAFVGGAALMLLTGGLELALGVVLWLLVGDEASASTIPADFIDGVRAAYTGSAGEVVLANIAGYPATLLLILLLQGLPALGAMLVGLAAARSRLFTDQQALTRVWRRLWPWAPVAGVAGAVLYTAASQVDDGALLLVAFGITTLTAPLLTATYAAALLAWHRRRPDSVVLLGLAATGRLALTNYLFQSVAMAAIFTGYGLALMDVVSGPQIWLVIGGIYTGQVVGSTLWLRHHRYGPAEWAMRRWTQGARRPVDDRGRG